MPPIGIIILNSFIIPALYWILPDMCPESSSQEFCSFAVIWEFYSFLRHGLIQIFYINKRGDTVDEKIKKLDVELNRYREHVKKTRSFQQKLPRLWERLPLLQKITLSHQISSSKHLA
ncbi:uncharacterized protein LOC112191870 isoform X2 [Rosa chinensis]|uniref:uncharacterized protein LOC112191870 isoform X2 n=1 Tax=Rosa chinensis TaxID=74649 RepID=UPI001AD90256|nr:uncharacterized protein LOC112191870 isoform X2 [Rosa chinensis]